MALLGFDPRLIPSLPLATTLACRRADGGGQLFITTSQAVSEALSAREVPVFVGGELWELTLAAEHDRAWPSTVAEWCTRKAHDPTWRLTEQEALAGVRETLEPRGWTLEQVLRRLGLELVWVGVGDEVPA